jgi:hypothetical protein
LVYIVKKKKEKLGKKEKGGGERTVEVGAGEGLDYSEAEEEVSRADPAFGDDVSLLRRPRI